MVRVSAYVGVGCDDTANENNTAAPPRKPIRTRWQNHHQPVFAQTPSRIHPEKGRQATSDTPLETSVQESRCEPGGSISRSPEWRLADFAWLTASWRSESF